MIKIGLTGGIGSGKSTVSFMLKEAGFEVVDADVIAKEVLVKYPEILEKVKIEFGSGFLIGEENSVERNLVIIFLDFQSKEKSMRKLYFHI